MKTHKKSASYLGLYMALALCGTAACGPDNNANNGSTQDMTDSKDDMSDATDMDGVVEDMTGDMQGDMTDVDMSPDMEDMCVPLTECPAETCGEISDGCGGTVQCEPCSCVGGAPVSTTCGPCGLGQPTCEGDGDGFATCSLESLTITEDMCVSVIYVAPSTSPGEGASEGDGSLEAPLDDVQAAIDMLASTGGLVALRAGEYAVPEQLKLAGGVHLVGGISEEGYFDDMASSKLVITPSGEEGDMVGVSATDISQKTWLKQLDIVTQDVEAGQDLYSMHVLASPGLHLEEVTILSGTIADGEHGKTGTDGADGQNGNSAENLVTKSARVGTTFQAGTYKNGADAGLRGQNTLCPEANGGNGGEGSYINVKNGAVTVVTAKSGSPNAAGVPGGAPGREQVPDGADGTTGLRGEDGSYGAAGDPEGSLVRGFWVADMDGENGEDGGHGEGGSGGGGTFWMEEAANPMDSKPGASGGGGGAGGCGGAGGEGGQGGGTGFGLLVVDSTGLVLDRVTIQGPNAGNGGNGGEGSLGGRGGSGGVGSQTYADDALDSPVPHSRNAGRGGLGGDGGDGGKGGGGAGGSSYGIYCSNTTVEKVDPVDVSAGVEGTGGMGTVKAEDGEAQDMVACW